MKTRKLSPYLISGGAFVAVILIAVCFVVVVTLFVPPPLSPTMEVLYKAVTNAAFPVAFAVGVLAYRWARSKQEPIAGDIAPPKRGAHLVGVLLVVGLALVVSVLVARQTIVRQGETTGLDELLESETTELDELLESGRVRLEAGEYPEAIADLEAAVEADPGSSEAHFLLGQAYNRTGDLLKARDEFRTVVAFDPDNAAAHHNLGVTYFQLQDPASAVAEFETALELDPDDPDTHYQLGAVYLVLALSGTDAMVSTDPQLLEQAIAEFEAALELEENMPEALIGMGNIYIQQADYVAAIKVLQRAIEQAPDSPQAYYALGEAYAQNGDTASACEAYGHFLTLDPPPAWRGQGEQAMTALGCP